MFPVGQNTMSTVPQFLCKRRNSFVSSGKSFEAPRHSHNAALPYGVTVPAWAYLNVLVSCSHTVIVLLQLKRD